MLLPSPVVMETGVSAESYAVLSADLDFFTTGTIKQSVNMSPLDPKTLESLRGYLNLAYRLGLLISQLDRAAPAGEGLTVP